jgi:hypothetical protein
MVCVECRNPAVQWHHVIYQQHLRQLGADPSDERDMVPVCLTCHARHHLAQQRLRLATLPDQVYAFALEAFTEPGPAYEYLHRRYLGPDPRLDALLAAA